MHEQLWIFKLLKLVNIFCYSETIQKESLKHQMFFFTGKFLHVSNSPVPNRHKAEWALAWELYLAFCKIEGALAEGFYFLAYLMCQPGLMYVYSLTCFRDDTRSLARYKFHFFPCLLVRLVFICPFLCFLCFFHFLFLFPVFFFTYMHKIFTNRRCFFLFRWNFFNLN